MDHLSHLSPEDTPTTDSVTANSDDVPTPPSPPLLPGAPGATNRDKKRGKCKSKKKGVPVKDSTNRADTEGPDTASLVRRLSPDTALDDINYEYDELNPYSLFNLPPPMANIDPRWDRFNLRRPRDQLTVEPFLTPRDPEYGVPMCYNRRSSTGLGLASDTLPETPPMPANRSFLLAPSHNPMSHDPLSRDSVVTIPDLSLPPRNAMPFSLDRPIYTPQQNVVDLLGVRRSSDIIEPLCTHSLNTCSCHVNPQPTDLTQRTKSQTGNSVLGAWVSSTSSARRGSRDRTRNPNSDTSSESQMLNGVFSPEAFLLSHADNSSTAGIGSRSSESDRIISILALERDSGAVTPTDIMSRETTPIPDIIQDIDESVEESDVVLSMDTENCSIEEDQTINMDHQVSPSL